MLISTGALEGVLQVGVKIAGGYMLVSLYYGDTSPNAWYCTGELSSYNISVLSLIN